MLGDNAERTKNPLKKAMKRRAAKTVQFAAPTYVEASDYDYSDEEDDLAEARAAHTAAAAANTNGAAQQQAATTAAAAATSEAALAARRGSGGSIEDGPASPKMLDRAEAAPLKSRKGTTRNADSFLKDDSAETRKFTLTPNLLRDDSARSGSTSDSGRSRTGSPSSDITAPSDSPKTKKEKKQRTLSGLFKSSKKKEKEKEKSKDRLARKEYVSDGEVERASIDAARQSTSALPADSASRGMDGERKASQKGRKLQKQQTAQAASTQGQATTEIAAAPQGPVFAELEGSQVAYEAPTGLEDEIPAVKSKKDIKGGKVKKARKREVLDDFDEVRESSDTKGGSFMHGTEVVHIPLQVGEYESSDEDDEEDDIEADGLDTGGEDREGSSSPPSLQEVTDSPRIPSAGDTRQQSADPTTVPMQDISSRAQDAHIMPPPGPPPTRAPPTPNGIAPSPVEPEQSMNSMAASALQSSPTSTSSTTIPRTWNDTALRAWLDGENNDMQDMLTVVYDTTGVKPAGPDHPLMKGYLVEERTQLDSMMAELDRMHNDFIKRRTGTNGPPVMVTT